MSQTALEMPDGLRPPFWVVVWRYGSEIRNEDDQLAHLVRSAAYGSDAGEHYVHSIGDADGVLWQMDNPLRGWQATERAPAPNPYKFVGVEGW